MRRSPRSSMSAAIPPSIWSTPWTGPPAAPSRTGWAPSSSSSAGPKARVCSTRRRSRRLRRLGAERPRAAAAALAQAHQVREVLHDLFGAIAGGHSPASALARFNRLLAEAAERLEMAPTAGPRGAGYAWRWRGSESDPRALVWPLLWSAANLLRSDEIGNVRVCDGDDCGWMYVDRSRNGLRRWCQMRTCGTREKTRRRRVGAT